ncbi:hypothetical protein B9Z19DRAFT_1134022 [Tuber borchii]|uniref:Uncharacterized protein n=1 Tax=Tuber borchii TaxID=42251 RepID=A0A2T6ZEV2_TUBBO|nr:hypothetical protein B9Z19DRAFT_1134022 [Tuber borchii]
MSASQTPTPTPPEAQEILRDIADLLCPAHKHNISAPRIMPGLPTHYSMVIGCPQEGDIKWQVGMSADFLAKVIRRCKVLSDSPLGHVDVTTLAPLSVWEGDQCNDILWLLDIGHLKEGWWEDNPSRLSDQRKDYKYGFSFPYFLHWFFPPLVSQQLDGMKKRLRVCVY